MKFKFEQIEDGVKRAKVIGGWIVKTTDGTMLCDGPRYFTALVFIPDPEHEWEIKK